MTKIILNLLSYKKKAISIKSPSDFLGYKNERVIKRYMKDLNVEHEVAENVFDEMLKFLYLCTIMPTPCSPPSKEIDNMWHLFILHTIDYFIFCEEYCGQYIHHDPTESPYTNNRQEMYEVAIQTFSNLEPKFWKHLFTSRKEDCGSSCGNDNYCDGIGDLELKFSNHLFNLHQVTTTK